MQEILHRYLASGFLFTTEIADPTLPLIIIACSIVIGMVIFIRISGSHERRLKKNILPDTTLDFESEIGRQKRALAKHFKQERYNYASGFIPGAEPELSFIDPARRGDPIEVITTKETYKPTAEPLVERPLSATDKFYPAKNGARMSAPFKAVVNNAVTRPVLTPEIDAASIKMPEPTPLPAYPLSVNNVNSSEPEKKAQNKNAPKEPKPTRSEKKAAKKAAKTAPVAIPTVAAAAIKDTEKKAPAEEAKLPKIALTDSVKKVEKKTDAPKDTHRVVITAVPVVYPKPARKNARNEFKVSVKKMNDVGVDE